MVKSRNKVLLPVLLCLCVLRFMLSVQASERTMPSVRQLLVTLHSSRKADCRPAAPSYPVLRKLYEVRLIDLDGDGRRDALVSSRNACDCTPTGNCEFWIYRQTRDGWVQIFDTGDVQTVSVRRSSAFGFRDVVTTTHNDAFESEYRIHRYDGREYKEVRCVLRQYRYLDSSGREHILRKPRFVPGC